jgi:hypothetical protein
MTRARCLVALLAVLTLGAARADAAVHLDKYGDFTFPVYVAAPPGDKTRVFVVEKAGKIQVVSSGVKKQFLDISSLVATSGERGLSSMAFDPGYATNGLFYVMYASSTSSPVGNIKIVQYQRSSDPDAANTTPVQVLLDVPHSATNHNGGQLQFGPAPGNYLYATIGDNVSGANAQNVSTGNVYGKILRLDPTNGTAPATNPLTGATDEKRIWAYGLRNPWRFSFDSATGDLVIADVGESAREEIDFTPASSGGGSGANFGWNCREGDIAGPGGCTVTGATEPVLVYDHSGGRCAITGGYVMHAADVPSLEGRYVYGDYCAGAINSVLLTNTAGTNTSELVTVALLTSFGLDACGQLYAASQSGPVYRVTDQAPAPGCPLPVGTSPPPPPVQPPPATPPPGQPPATNPPAADQPPPGPAGPAAVDRQAPRLIVGFRRRQRAARSRAVVIGARCDEPCRLSAAGLITGIGRRLRLRAAVAQSGATAAPKLRLRQSRTDALLVERALVRGAAIAAHIRVSAVDAAGNAAPVQRIVVRLAG